MPDDPAAREEIRRFYRAQHGKLLAYVTRRVVSRADAEDVCQEIWLRFWVRFDEHRANPDRLVRLLYVIAPCRVADHWRKRGRTPEAPIEGEDLVALTDSLCANPRLRWMPDSRIDVKDALAALPPRQREALHLHHLDDLTVLATATVMGIGENAVKKLLKKALEKLRTTGVLACYGPEGEPR